MWSLFGTCGSLDFVALVFLMRKKYKNISIYVKYECVYIYASTYVWIRIKYRKMSFFRFDFFFLFAKLRQEFFSFWYWENGLLNCLMHKQKDRESNKQQQYLRSCSEMVVFCPNRKEFGSKPKGLNRRTIFPTSLFLNQHSWFLLCYRDIGTKKAIPQVRHRRWGGRGGRCRWRWRAR